MEVNINNIFGVIDILRSIEKKLSGNESYAKAFLLIDYLKKEVLTGKRKENYITTKELQSRLITNRSNCWDILEFFDITDILKKKVICPRKVIYIFLDLHNTEWNNLIKLSKKTLGFE